MRTSLCMIVRDEAELIGECLRSVRGLVDEIVAVDTGSTDRTAEILREHGARVFSFEWNGDFSAARNRSLAEAKGDWILVLDADERLFPRHLAAVRRVVRNPRAQALQVFVRTYTDDSTLMNWQPIDPTQTESKGFCGYCDRRQVRLFRRRDHVRFEGVVHETVARSLERKGVSIHRVDLLIHHYKALRPPPNIEERNRLIYDLSRRRAEDEPDDDDVWRQRAMAALEVGEHDDAVASLQKAAELAADKPDICFQLGMVLTLIGRAEAACEQLREALERFPDEPEIVQVFGEALLAAGRRDDAHETFARSLELDPYLYRSLIGLGTIAIEEGQTAAATDYLERARSIHPGLDVPHVHMGLHYLRGGQLDEALAELRRAFASNPKRWQSLAGIGEILFETGRFEQAREWYLKAVEAAGCPPAVFVKLCACCTALGLADEAREWADKAAAADPAYAVVGAKLAPSS